MFVGREKELSDLNSRYERGSFEFAVIYGRRRVGKTTLINEFVKDKECIVYTATETNEKQNLTDISQSIYALSDEFKGSNAVFDSFRDAFETVFRMGEKRRIVFVIDEYPYLAECSKGLSSVLQLCIDKYHGTSQVFLILCGSSMSFMENQVMGYKSPLYGRRTCQYKIRPFDFFETASFYSRFKPNDLAVIYGMTGGIPLYLSMMNDKMSVEQNIKQNYLTPNAYLYEEPQNLIKQECRDASQYNSIISAIASGATRVSEICSKTGIDSSLTSNYLTKLIGLGIVKRETAFGAKNDKKSIYTIEDLMFRFWYRFVQDNTSIINRGLADVVYNKIEPHLTEFMGAVFEEICIQYMWRQLINGKSTVQFTDIGRWWGSDPRTKQQAEIDIVGTAGTTMIFGECKWRNEKTDVSVLNALIDKSGIFSVNDKVYYLFSKSYYTKGCLEKAESMENVTLVTYDDIIQSL